MDVIITLPADYTSHYEIDASTKGLLIENLRMDRLEYDGDAQQVYIRDVSGSAELTGKIDYDITLEGTCTKLDVNQFCTNAIVHIADPTA